MDCVTVRLDETQKHQTRLEFQQDSYSGFTTRSGLGILCKRREQPPVSRAHRDPDETGPSGPDCLEIHYLSFRGEPGKIGKGSEVGVVHVGCVVRCVPAALDLYVQTCNARRIQCNATLSILIVQETHFHALTASTGECVFGGLKTRLWKFLSGMRLEYDTNKGQHGINLLRDTKHDASSVQQTPGVFALRLFLTETEYPLHRSCSGKDEASQRV